MTPLIDNVYVNTALLVALLAGLIWLGMECLRYWRKQFTRERNLVERINTLLPQTQCGQCGYEGCLPYARAIAAGDDINQCPPGGTRTILALADLLNEFPRPLNPAHGRHEPARVAFIREDECIGCTKCIKACPVDAILGGPKLMHTVIAKSCTGCDLCVAPCPVDCIDMLPIAESSRLHWVLPSEIRAASPELSP